MRKLSQLLPILALLAAPAGGAVLTDDEPSNNAVATAGIQVFKTGPVTTKAGELALTFGDNDFIGIAGLLKDDIVIVSTTPLEDPPFFESPDTVVGVFDSATTDPATEGLCINDDNFNNDLDFPTPIGFGSLCRFVIQTDGTYFVGITGFSVVLPFDGGHFKFGDYAVTVTVFSAPEPGLLLQLASGLLGLAVLDKRRRRVRGNA